jgi:hypothetical protein
MGELSSKEAFVYSVAESKWTKATDMITGRYGHREDGNPHMFRAFETTQLNIFCIYNLIYIHSKDAEQNR